MKTKDTLRILDRLDDVRNECNDAIGAVYRSYPDAPLTREETQKLREYLSTVHAIVTIAREEIEKDGGTLLTRLFDK